MRKALIISLVVILVILVVLIYVGCSLRAANYTEADSGKTLEVSAGKQFTITLRGNQTTGYVWQMAKGTNSKIVKKISDVYTSDNTGLVGAGGDHVWTFKAIAAGETIITLNYLRLWEKPVVPANTLKYKIKVQ